MREYTLIMLNMIEHADMHLKKQSGEYARILSVSDEVTEQLSRQRRIQNTVKYSRWSVLQKE